MKGTIIGTDLLEYNDSVKILEINTNTTIFNSGAELLDYDSLFSVLTQNNISELHFIYNEEDSYIATEDMDFKFEEILKEKCLENNIIYFPYKVPKYSITVPYIEDTADKFILRQAFDTTALVDSTYCADKFEFGNLMTGSIYSTNTYFTSPDLSFDNLNTIIEYTGGQPNIVKKSRYPDYDFGKFPSVHKLDTNAELSDMKDSLEDNFLLQDFIFDESNIVNNRWNIIRSIDIIYGGELDIVNMGAYRTSTSVNMDFCLDEFEPGTKQLNTKSRFKWVNKVSKAKIIDYHTDADSLILNASGSLISMDDIDVGDSLKSIDFTNLDGYSPSDDLPIEYGKRWDSTIPQIQNTLTDLDVEVQSIVSQSIDGLYINLTLEDGTIWSDLGSTVYCTELSGSDVTQFNKLNHTIVGDKLLIYNKNTSEITKKEITNLEVVYDSKMAYSIDVEPSDLFLVDVNVAEFAIQHNYSCDWCGWYSCGDYRCDYGCFGCSGGGEKGIR